MQSAHAVGVFLLAENRLLRESLVRFLSKRSSVRVVGTSHYCAESLEQLCSLVPHIVILDSVLAGGSGARLIPVVRQRATEAKVVMVGMDRDEKRFLQCVEEGCLGYVLQDASALEVALAIQGVNNGEAIFPSCL